MDDAGVNVAARLRNLFLNALILQFGQQLVDFFGAIVDFAFEHAALHRLTNSVADSADVPRLVEVVARAQTQRLPHGIRRLKRRNHYCLYVWTHKPEPF